MRTLAVAAAPAIVALAPGSALATQAPSKLTLAKQVGQLVIATYAQVTPPASLLGAIRAGHVGAVILMGVNTKRGVTATRAAVDAMQRAARAGGNPGLLVMTDQEGGEVKRLPGPPDYPAARMSNPATARAQGVATGRLLKAAGVNVDLAPDADVVRSNGFIAQQQRSFGSDPARVAAAACSFAKGLAGTGVAYTLKHFPGLGDALQSTDTQPVAITESATAIHADAAAYRQCGRGPLALVMISSASYRYVTGTAPAVLSPVTYGKLLPQNDIGALPISDSFEGGAIAAPSIRSPARTAIAAGLDMVMYANRESDALVAYSKLTADVRDGTLKRTRVAQAAARVLQLKSALGLLRG